MLSNTDCNIVNINDIRLYLSMLFNIFIYYKVLFYRLFIYLSVFVFYKIQKNEP